MREIKFRAWDKRQKFMHEPQSYIFNGMWHGGRKSATSDLAVMQYTGLKDKNGKEIYEGDIVKQHHKFLGGSERDDYYKVFYGATNCGCCHAVYGFAFKPLLKTKNELESGMYKYLEVIGNIYENPELMK